MRPVFKYFGSKWRKAKLYPQPSHNLIIEPFAGSACYAMYYLQSDARYACILADSNPRIANLWRWINTNPHEEIMDLPTKSLILGDDITKMGFSESAAELIIRWQRVGLNGCQTVSKWNCTPGQWDENVKVSVSNAVKILAGRIEVYNDYSQIKNQTATWFVDPPYRGQTKYYHEQREINYESLSGWCKSRNGQTIVYEQNGATWLPFEPLAKTIRLGKTTPHYDCYWSKPA